MKIETKIAKNGSTRYYVRDNETGKLRRISAEKAAEIEAAVVEPVNVVEPAAVEADAARIRAKQ